MKSTLYKDGGSYDKAFNPTHDIDIWRTLTKGREEILELCCGTGRIIMSLLPDHKEITGIDNSKAMLAEAKVKTAAFHNKIHLYKRNIARFDLKRTFDSILLINNSFNHLYTKPEALRFLSCLKKHMTSDTEFILQAHIKDMRPHYKPDKIYPYTIFIDETDGKTIEVFDGVEYLYRKKVAKREWFYYKENKLLRKSFIYIRIYTLPEIRALFTKNGFYFTQEYGGYNYEPVNALSPTYIAVLKKK